VALPPVWRPWMKSPAIVPAALSYLSFQAASRWTRQLFQIYGFVAREASEEDEESTAADSAQKWQQLQQQPQQPRRRLLRPPAAAQILLQS
jgi:hypothetical protein